MFFLFLFIAFVVDFPVIVVTVTKKDFSTAKPHEDGTEPRNSLSRLSFGGMRGGGSFRKEKANVSLPAAPLYGYHLDGKRLELVKKLLQELSEKLTAISKKMRSKIPKWMIPGRKKAEKNEVVDISVLLDKEVKESPCEKLLPTHDPKTGQLYKDHKLRQEVKQILHQLTSWMKLKEAICSKSPNYRKFCAKNYADVHMVDETNPGMSSTSDNNEKSKKNGLMRLLTSKAKRNELPVKSPTMLRSKTVKEEPPRPKQTAQNIKGKAIIEDGLNDRRNTAAMMQKSFSTRKETQSELLLDKGSSGIEIGKKKVDPQPKFYEPRKLRPPTIIDAIRNDKDESDYNNSRMTSVKPAKQSSTLARSASTSRASTSSNLRRSQSTSTTEAHRHSLSAAVRAKKQTDVQTDNKHTGISRMESTKARPKRGVDTDNTGVPLTLGRSKTARDDPRLSKSSISRSGLHDATKKGRNQMHSGEQQDSNFESTSSRSHSMRVDHSNDNSPALGRSNTTKSDRNASSSSGSSSNNNSRKQSAGSHKGGTSSRSSNSMTEQQQQVNRQNSELRESRRMSVVIMPMIEEEEEGEEIIEDWIPYSLPLPQPVKHGEMWEHGVLSHGHNSQITKGRRSLDVSSSTDPQSLSKLQRSASVRSTSKHSPIGLSTREKNAEARLSTDIPSSVYPPSINNGHRSKLISTTLKYLSPRKSVEARRSVDIPQRSEPTISSGSDLSPITLYDNPIAQEEWQDPNALCMANWDEVSKGLPFLNDDEERMKKLFDGFRRVNCLLQFVILQTLILQSAHTEELKTTKDKDANSLRQYTEKFDEGIMELTGMLNILLKEQRRYNDESYNSLFQLQTHVIGYWNWLFNHITSARQIH